MQNDMNSLYPDAARAQMVAARRRSAIGTMIKGLIFLVLGLAITIVTYKLASGSASGGRYVVTYGLVLVGLFNLVRGAIAMSQANKVE